MAASARKRWRGAWVGLVGREHGGLSVSGIERDGEAVEILTARPDHATRQQPKLRGLGFMENP